MGRRTNEMSETIHTPLTQVLGIKYPVMLAGMNAVATSELVAAVTNAGGIGTIGGLTMTPKMLQLEIDEVKKSLNDPNAPFGVDLAIPQIGGNARKTNHDYTHGKLSPLTGQPVMVVAGGGMYDGRSLAAALSLGAAGVWVGTRFIATTESGAPPRHVDHVLKASVSDTVKTLIYSGRPLRTFKTPYVVDFEERQQEIKDYCDKGIIPIRGDYKRIMTAGGTFSKGKTMALLMGQSSGAVTQVLPAAQIIDEMMVSAISILKTNASLVGAAKL